MFGKKKKILAWLADFMKENPEAQISFVKKSWYDCEILYKGKLLLCCFYKLPKNCQMTINNKYIWQILNGTSNFKTFSGVERLIDGRDPRKHVRVGIIVNNTQKIRRWINECEMEFVDPYTDIYGAKVCDLDKLSNQFMAL